MFSVRICRENSAASRSCLDACTMPFVRSLNNPVACVQVSRVFVTNCIRCVQSRSEHAPAPHLTARMSKLTHRDDHHPKHHAEFCSKKPRRPPGMHTLDANHTQFQVINLLTNMWTRVHRPIILAGFLFVVGLILLILAACITTGSINAGKKAHVHVTWHRPCLAQEKHRN